MYRWKKQSAQVGQSLEEIDENVPIMRELAWEPVTHVEEYLAYYVSRLEPGYAVLVTGGWGSGKTHQVRSALPDTHAHYVSLFGLDTTEAIEGQMFAAMYPGKAAIRKLAQKTDGVSLEIPLLGALSTGGLGSALTSIFIKDAVDKSKPLILDDLERSTVDIKMLLGLINRYVEHHKCRVIVIAHDSKIVKDFVEAKEKVFGQTLLVEPNIEAAFSAFVSEFAKEEEPQEVGALKREILAAFKEAGSDSLRVLRHVVEDVGPPRAIIAAAEKYTSVDIGSSLLHDQVLVETLIEGRFIAEHIRHSIDASAYFLKGEEAAPWQIVGGFDKLDDGIVNEALRRMEEQFSGRKILESGEFLHVVALKMMMAFRRLTVETVTDVKTAAFAYIDELLAKGVLPERPAGRNWTESLDSGFANVVYWVHDEYRKEFTEVFDHLMKARGTALDRLLPQRVDPLLQVVRTDGKEFFEKVCYTRNGNIEFEDIPILAHIPPKDFVEAWLASPKTGWYWIGNALKERRKAVAHNPSLLPENAWYPKVLAELMTRAKAEVGLTQLRIIRTAEQIGLPMPAIRHVKVPAARVKATPTARAKKPPTKPA